MKSLKNSLCKDLKKQRTSLTKFVVASSFNQKEDQASTFFHVVLRVAFTCIVPFEVISTLQIL